MKYIFTITEALHRLNLIKFFRKEINGIELSTAVDYADNLPYSFRDISQTYFNELKEKIKDIALYKLTEEDIENEIWYNQNINPPIEYIEANSWYETLSDKEKSHVDQIVLWRNRAAVC